MTDRPTDEPASGERFVPELMGGDLLEAEHEARYRLAAPHGRGRRVLDAGCGVGWGSNLLLDAGAAEVTGLDIDLPAVRDARRRATGARFEVGDLGALPFGSACFDVVVCFEALEHVADPLACLDELVRVLHPDGLLFVSSPNPDVYPAGNPFHVRELAPDELSTEVGKRLPHTLLLRQHLLVSSVLAADPADDAPLVLDVDTTSVVPLEPGHDPYSLVIGSRSPLPPMPGVAVVAPSHQLDNLDALANALTDERTTLHDDHQRMVAEREVLLRRRDDDAAALDELRAQLEAADTGLRRLTDDAERGAAELVVLHAQVAEMIATRLELEDRIEQQVAALGDERQRADDRVERAGRERDRYAADLVQSEQALARHAATVAELRAELDAMLATLSWRVTVPLRDVRRRLPRR